MPNEITPETLREWAAEADEGEEIVLGAKELRELADQQEKMRRQLQLAEKVEANLIESLNEALERAR